MIEGKGNVEEDDFTWVHNPKVKHKKSNESIIKTLNNMDAKIQKIQHQIMLLELSKVSEKIVEIIDMEDDERKKCFFLNFSKGQTHDLDIFLKFFIDSSQAKWKKFNISIIKIYEEDIMGILLKIYTYIEENQGEHLVFLLQKITNFDYKDIKTLRRSLEKGRYSIIIPTYKSLIDVDNLNYSGYYHMALYNHKQLLVQFMARIVMDPTIKAYMPPQILNLISDLDFYPTSYRESVRRFTISYKKFLIYNHKHNIKLVPVQFTHIYEAIVDVLKLCTARGDVKIEDRFLKAVYDKDYIFRIPKSVEDVILTKEEIQRDNIDNPSYNNVDRIAEILKQRLKSDPLLKKYSDDVGGFTQSVVQNPSKNSKYPRDRMAALDIPKSIIGKSEQLNRQITKIIRDITEKVRSQAQLVPWQQISYDELCRPQIMVEICQDVKRDPKLLQIFQNSNKYSQIFHRDNYTKTNVKISEYHYLMAELEYLGLIENSKKQIDPTYYNQIFKKTNYRME